MTNLNRRERPILFSDPLVRALLEGRKTETRRVLKGDVTAPRALYDAKGVAPKWHDRSMVYDQPLWFPMWMYTDVDTGFDFQDRGHLYRCPYGREGDWLYVRETWASGAMLDDWSPKKIGQGALDAGWEHPWAPLWFRADDARNTEAADSMWKGRGKWRPSIHMPKWASRIWLRVTEVRVERLRNITHEAITAEGVGCDWQPDSNQFATFARLWDFINAKPGADWAANPWVWVVRFEVVSTTGRPS